MDVLSVIIPIAEQGVHNIERDYKPSTNEGKFEIFMFNTFLGWMFYLERNQIDMASGIGNRKLLKLFEYSLKQGIKWEIAEMVELYKERYHFYSKDISGIKNSNYPITKQYLPAYTFHAIYYEPLKKSQDLSWASYNDFDTFNLEKSENLSEFAGVLIKQINRTFKELGM